MIEFAAVELMARGASTGLLLLWSALLIRDHMQALPARMALALNIAIICHILGTFPSGSYSNIVDAMFEFISVLVPGLFWLFARTWFNDEARVGWRSWTSIGLSLAVAAWVIMIWDDGGVLPNILGAILRVMMIGFACLGLWALWRGRAEDLIENRRQLRMWFVGMVGAYVLLVNMIEIIIFAKLGPDWLRGMTQIGIFWLTLGLCTALFNVRHRDLFEPIGRSNMGRAPIVDTGQKIVAERLLHHMTTERAWRDERLSVASLAAQLGEQEYRLRRVINGVLGYRNFSAFVNGYRLDEVKEALSDSSQKTVPIITIALDAGFGSLGPFNRAFRESEGMTPSEYRKTHINI